MKNFRPKLKAQDGITLLLSILILSGMFIITITVSYFAIQELRIARSSALSEPAIVAAETSGEQGIWLIKRNTFATNCPSALSTNIDGTTDAATSPKTTVTTKCVSYDNATFEIKPNGSVTFFLYDPASINGNLCMNTTFDLGTHTGCSGGQLYRTLEFNMKAGNFSSNASAKTIDDKLFPGSSVTIPPDGSKVFISIPDPIASADDERIEVTISNPSPTDFTTIQVTSTGGVITGLPDFPTVDAEGCASLLNLSSCNEAPEVSKRRVNITVPR